MRLDHHVRVSFYGVGVEIEDLVSSKVAIVAKIDGGVSAHLRALLPWDLTDVRKAAASEG
jgi:hypothetical protein